MSFLYNRVIDIRRPATQSGAGAIEYGGLEFAALAEVALAVPCNIQSAGNSRVNPAGLPGDTIPATWKINIPRGKVADGVIQDRDICRDDLGREFAVTADYSHSMGWRLTCDRLE